MELWQKYPFSEEARRRARQEGLRGVTVEELEKTSEKILGVLRGGKSEFSPKEYSIARLLLAASGSNYSLELFAKTMAKQYAEELEKAGNEEFEWAATQVFPSFEKKDGSYSISVLDYVAFGKNLAGEQIEGGRVFFGRRGLLNLLQQAVEAKIKDVKADAKALPVEVKEEAKKLAAEAPKPKFAASGYRGRYLSLPAMQTILNGVSEGKRYYASIALAIACLKDKLPREEAEGIMRTYARNCSRSTHPFTEKEAVASLDWVYKHPTINFSLRALREQQIVDDETLNKTAEVLRQSSRRGRTEK